ncbi:Uncharacterised protein [Legionella beliardensis]|uniref:Uncharacterized protein n=1 Tax=Legionella beliardensis TaxID=91822 RepID=A0A378I1I4_9GAMM|nr:hypothetical protein [Legionella beliardensis]STX28591.1 Uncharacterised protein [Legionella beliardensis]
MTHSKKSNNLQKNQHQIEDADLEKISGGISRPAATQVKVTAPDRKAIKTDMDRKRF